MEAEELHEQMETKLIAFKQDLEVHISISMEASAIGDMENTEESL